jgi:NAD(P)H-dependent FMN reductase
MGIIVGSTRPGRHARAVADWVLAQGWGRSGANYEIVDLAAFTPARLHNDAEVTLFGQLDSWVGALKPLRG